MCTTWIDSVISTWILLRFSYNTIKRKFYFFLKQDYSILFIILIQGQTQIYLYVPMWIPRKHNENNFQILYVNSECK